MSKTMSWPSRVIYIAIALALVVSLGVLVIAPKASADPGLTKWTKVGTPSEKNMTIFPASNLYDFAVGPDGETIYAIGEAKDKDDVDGDANVSEILPHLWKSTDGGATWTNNSAKLLVKNVKLGLPAEFDKLTQIAVAPDDDDFVAISGTLTTGAPAVVGSTNGSTTFYYTGALPAVVNSTAMILSLDISREVDGVYNMAIGTNDGFVCRYVAGTYWGGSWADATDAVDYPGWVASTAVTSVAFSPSWSADRSVAIISTDSVTGKTWLQTAMWGTHTGWGAIVERAGAVEFKVGTTPIEPVAIFPGVTGMALPVDYNGYDSGMRTVYAYVDTDEVTPNGGYVFRVDNTSLVGPMGPTGNPWLASIAYHGTIDEGDAMLGQLSDNAPNWPPTATACCSGIQVWHSTSLDPCCVGWKTACKPPSGQAYAIVAFTPDGKKGYATTQGEGLTDESAFSVSLDKGVSWNQLGLIDTDIDYLSDVAVPPDCSVHYLASVNEWESPEVCDCDSVWMKDANADYYADVWQRVYHKELLGADEMGLLRLSPEYEDGDVVYWGDADSENLYWASAKGLGCWNTRNTTLDIQDFGLADDDTVYVVDDGGDVSKYIGGVHDWSTAVDSKVAIGHSITVHGDHILVGGTDSKVGYSDDGAGSFTALDNAISGDVHLAFDSYFSGETANSTIYAAVAGADAGIYRWVIGDSSEWTNLNALPYDYYGIVLDNADGNPKTDATHGGVLYAATDEILDGLMTYSGVARCLTPAQTACCGSEEWDYLHAGLGGGPAESFSLEPSSLRICGCLTPSSNSQLYAIDNDSYVMADGSDGALWAYEDCFAKSAPALSAPRHGSMIPADACICVNEEVVLKWERQCNACSYDWAIALDDAFTEVVLSGTEYTPPSGAHPAVVIAEGALDCDQSYLWHVRSADAETGEIIHSPWSETWLFTVEAGPGGGVRLTAPDDGASNVPISNVGFTWTGVANAGSYSWVLSPNADLSSPLETKTTLAGTAYTYTGTLDNEATYFWQVKAMKGANVLSTSAVATFSTAAVPVTPPPPVEVTTYPPAPPPSTPSWVWVVIGIGAVLVIVVIVLIFRTRRV